MPRLKMYSIEDFIKELHDSSIGVARVQGICKEELVRATGNSRVMMRRVFISLTALKEQKVVTYAVGIGSAMSIDDEKFDELKKKEQEVEQKIIQELEKNKITAKAGEWK